MKALADGRTTLTERVERHLDGCLNCRACEPACPSGVQYGRLIDATREQVAAHSAPGGLERLMLSVVAEPRRLRRALTLARLGQTLGLEEFLRNSGLLERLPRRWGALLTMLPPLDPPHEPLPQWSEPAGPLRARVGLFLGCVNEAVCGAGNRAMRNVLLANGCAVYCPPAQNCCGAIHHHAGRHEEARVRAAQNIRAFLDVDPPLDAVVTNIAGCGAMLKEYAHLFALDDPHRARVDAFASCVRDIHEFLAALPAHPPHVAVPQRVAWHDPCHLVHAQRVRQQPRDLLRMIPSLELVDLPGSDRCCGAAGTYNLMQPEMADALAARKLHDIDRAGVNCVVTGNVGCLMQLLRHARLRNRPLRVVHTVDLLARAYGYQSASIDSPDLCAQ
jgi:glycolate oxidase iron-sulfur subunit